MRSQHHHDPRMPPKSDENFDFGVGLQLIRRMSPDSEQSLAAVALGGVQPAIAV